MWSLSFYFVSHVFFCDICPVFIFRSEVRAWCLYYIQYNIVLHCTFLQYSKHISFKQLPNNKSSQKKSIWLINGDTVSGGERRWPPAGCPNSRELPWPEFQCGCNLKSKRSSAGWAWLCDGSPVLESPASTTVISILSKQTCFCTLKSVSRLTFRFTSKDRLRSRDT